MVLVLHGGGGIFFPFFGPLVVSVRLGYLNTVSSYKSLADRQYFISLQFICLQFTYPFCHTKKQLSITVRYCKGFQ